MRSKPAPILMLGPDGYKQSLDLGIWTDVSTVPATPRRWNGKDWVPDGPPPPPKKWIRAASDRKRLDAEPERRRIKPAFVRGKLWVED